MQLLSCEVCQPTSGPAQRQSPSGPRNSTRCTSSSFSTSSLAQVRAVAWSAKSRSSTTSPIPSRNRYRVTPVRLVDLEDHLPDVCGKFSGGHLLRDEGVEFAFVGPPGGGERSWRGW